MKPEFQSILVWGGFFCIAVLTILLGFVLPLLRRREAAILSEQKLMERESQHRSIIQTAMDGFWRVDHNGRLLEVNETYCRMSGYTEEELLSMKNTDLDVILTKEERKKNIQRLLFQNENRFESQHRRKDGTLFDAEISIQYWSRGKNQFVVFIRDITERKQAEKNLLLSHEKFLTVLDSIDATIYVADMKTHEILFMNKFMVESFGRDMIGEICWKSFRNESGPCSHCTNDRLINKDGKPAGVCVWENKNPVTGKFYINYDRAIEWMDGRLVRLQVATDITDRRQMEEALVAANANLEQRVEERTQELQDQLVAKDQALTELAAAQNSLVEMSRAAGMAEVATGVLHNVGNVLNSVNVSCNLIMNQVRESRIANLAKAADLMAQYQDNLGRFLTEDPRGRQIPAYLMSLSPVLKEEHQLILRESEALYQRIEHIREIVTMQQTYGRVSGVIETIAPEQLMEDTLKLNAEALARHEITTHRQYREVPPITVDKHQVLQILLNLVNNAKYACAGMEKEKIITLRIFPSGPDRLSMQVSDNGAGILPENLTRIFQHGFTTRKTGHGFGLHSGAIAAIGLGGRLTGHSEGLGLGATFTLELPFYSGEKA